MSAFRRAWLPLPMLLTIAVPSAAQSVDGAAERLKADVVFLASDAMKGRQLGSEQYAAAATHVERAMAAAGLRPAGEGGGWTQPVGVVLTQSTAGQTMRLTRGARTSSLAFGRDWTHSAQTRPDATTVSAPVVFAGFGIVDPVSGRDDFAGLDVRGAIVAVLAGGPAALDPSRADFLRDRDYRARMAEARGAVGLIVVEGAAGEGRPSFARAAKRADGLAIGWRTPDRSVWSIEGAPYLGFLSRRGAARLFAGSPVQWNKVLAADRAGGAIPGGALGATLAVGLRNKAIELPTVNVVGRLDGSDPTLKAEHVVLTAHLDHIADGGAVKGDAIYNGAMDNAVGVAAMMEVARRLNAGPRPKRSILFVVVGAEEVGLIGSDYFARNPTVPRGSIVADVNLDMPILTYRFEDVVAIGAERSSVGPVVARVAKAHGVAMVPDPMPEEHNFVRSDNYSFVRQGIPAVSLELGPGGPGLAATKAFLKDHYHQPSDQPELIDWTSAVRFVAINTDIVRELADAAERPRWNPGDFFGLAYGGAATR